MFGDARKFRRDTGWKHGRRSHEPSLPCSTIGSGATEACSQQRDPDEDVTPIK